MGYTTEFNGEFRLSPPLTAKQVKTINNFCEARHGGNTNVYPGYPGFWCDWETNGEAIYWNGSEKSYNMLEWIQLLIQRYFIPWGVELDGEITAAGEDPADIWKMKADGYTVKRIAAKIVYEET